jgi:hypothetical protein
MAKSSTTSTSTCPSRCTPDPVFSANRGSAGKTTSDWVRKHHQLLLTGATGVGKSFLASAFAQKACRDGFTAFLHTGHATIPQLGGTAVNRACRYMPEVNVTYQEMAAHYGVAVVPASAWSGRAMPINTQQRAKTAIGSRHHCTDSLRNSTAYTLPITTAASDIYG